MEDEEEMAIAQDHKKSKLLCFEGDDSMIFFIQRTCISSGRILC